MMMFKIYNPLTGNVREELIGTTYLELWARDHGIDPNTLLVKVQGEVPRPRNADKESWDEYKKAKRRVRNIAKYGLLVDDVHYEKFCWGSSDRRNAKFALIRADLITEIKKYILMYFKDERGEHMLDIAKNNTPAKYGVYLAMCLLSNFHEDARAAMISIDDVVILDDINVDVTGVFDHVDGNTVTRKEMTVTNKVTDGIIYHVNNDDNWTDDMRKEFRRTARSWTIRPVLKGCVVELLKSDLQRTAERFGWNMIVKDHWGVERNLLENELIAFCSAFKWVKQVPTAEAWDDFRKGWKANGHQFGVCLYDHDGLADLPYQQFQTLLPHDDQTDALADRTIGMLKACSEPEEAAKLLPKWQRKVAELYPEIFGDQFFYNNANNTYASRRWGYMSGRIPAIARYRFACPDTMAVFRRIVGDDSPESAKLEVRPDSVVCNAVRKNTNIVDITRCPHLDNAHVIRKAQRDGVVSNLYSGANVYFSAYSADMNTMQMDFDGDHVAVAEDPEFVKLAIQSRREQGNVPLYYEAPGKKPGDVTDEDIIEDLSNLTAAPIGLYANALTKIWAFDAILDPRAKALLTRKTNTCVDAAKNDGDGEDKAVEAIRKSLSDCPLPMHLYYRNNPVGYYPTMTKRKDAEEVVEFTELKDGIPVFPAGSKEAEKYAFSEKSQVCRYMQRIGQNTEAVLNLNGVEEYRKTYRWKTLTNLDAKCGQIPGLTTENGLFWRIAFHDDKRQKEMNAMHADAQAVTEFRKTEVEAVRRLVYEFGENNGATPDETVNALICGIYRRGDSEATNLLKRVLWLCFGEVLYANVCKNLEVGVVPEDDADEPEYEPYYYDDDCCPPPESEEGYFTFSDYDVPPEDAFACA